VIDLSRKAKKFLAGLQKKQFEQLWGRIKDLDKDPRPHDSWPLTGYPDLFRLDFGEYRIVYGFTPTTSQSRPVSVPARGVASPPKPDYAVKIVVVDQRNDNKVYKSLRRSMGRG
jgi:mRNA-degrading endonuclease RelE of RelBE toxin-antitoxin system